MNFKKILNVWGKVLLIEAIALVLPAVVALCYSEWSVALIFLATAGGSGLIGFLLSLFKPNKEYFFAKDGLVTVALCWIALSLVGAIPFVLTGEIPNYVDALFETVSGFTTTGASILTDVTALSHGSLFWRSFTHFIGGMGILVLLTAFSAGASDRTMYILRAEMPGPIVDKIVPKAKDTAKILYILYLGITALMVIFLLFGGMDLFESLVTALGTAGTGGFGIKNDSIASYSPYLQWVIAVFMLLYGVNFNLYFLLFVGKIFAFFKNRELLTYVLVVIVSTSLVAVSLYPTIDNISDLIRTSFFEVSAIMTTTGFGVTDINAFPPIAKTVMLILMFIGGCAGSTAGGLKLTRVIIMFKKLGNDLKKTLHPKATSIVKFEGKRLDEEVIKSTNSYFVLYMILLLLIFILLSFDPNITGTTALETNFSSAVSCFNNIGPAFGQAAANYSCYGIFGKIVLTIAMLLGRLEIYPVLLIFFPTTWMKNK